MMTARDDTSTRPRKFNIMALLLAGSALGIAGCAQQRTEGYYDPPAESTVTDAQSQGSGAGYRTVLRAPSQCRSRSSPTPPARPPASRPRPRKRAIPPRTASRARRRRQRRRLGVAASGAAPARPCRHPRPAPPRTASCRSRRPTWARCCFARHAVHGAARDADAGAQRPLARPRRLPGKRRQAGRAGGRTRLLERHRRTPVARDPAGRQGQRTRRIRRRRQQCAARALHRRPDAQPELQPDPPARPGPDRRAGGRRAAVL